MLNIITDELQTFRAFKKSYAFVQKEITNTHGELCCEGIPLNDGNGNLTAICEQWVNAGYKLTAPLSKALSNLFPYKFIFREQQLQCIESFFQGIKFKDGETQRHVFQYAGLDSNTIQIASDYDWRETGYIYWQGKAIKRDSLDYENLIDEVYISAIQNPLYRQVLKKTDRYILHSIGEKEKSKTVFTRYEFELELNCLSCFLKL